MEILISSIFHHPDLSLPFIMKVDACSNGIKAILSLCPENSPKLYLCAFHSQKLTQAKRNYDIRNSKLLPIKAALQEQRHRLKGADYPFLILTHHRTLKSAKRLNPHQAQRPFSSHDLNSHSHIDQDPRAQKLVPGCMKELRKDNLVNLFFTKVRTYRKNKNPHQQNILQAKHLFPRPRENSSSGYIHHPLDATHSKFGEQQILVSFTWHVKACAVYTQS